MIVACDYYYYILWFRLLHCLVLYKPVDKDLGWQPDGCRFKHHKIQTPEGHTCTLVDNSPMTISELCSADLWCVSLSCPWTRSKSSLSDSRLSQADSSIPSRFHVRNWNVTDSVSAAASNGSDKKLLLELKKVADTSWGSEQVKVTFPWNDRVMAELKWNTELKKNIRIWVCKMGIFGEVNISVFAQYQTISPESKHKSMQKYVPFLLWQVLPAGRHTERQGNKQYVKCQDFQDCRSPRKQNRGLFLDQQSNGTGQYSGQSIDPSFCVV